MSNITTGIVIRESSSLIISLVLAAILSQLLYRWVSRLGPLSPAEAELELELDSLEDDEKESLAPSRES
jgi:hypothetical protein